MRWMRKRTRVAALAVLAASAVLTAPDGARAGTTAEQSAKPLTLAVIGDVPYGTAQEGSFHQLIDAVNADPNVRLAAHVGDIKSGSTTCTDERFAAVADAFDSFKDPLVYTPGDNEWTDCHRPNNGGYDPLERLAAVRSVFFAEPGDALGRHPMAVDPQAAFPENVRWQESRVVFATLHVVGSDNGLAPWTGLGHTTPTQAQQEEVAARVDAAIDWINATFDQAEEAGSRGVVLMMQADTWDPSPTSAQQAVVDAVGARTAEFDGEVLLLQGDSHEYVADNPLGMDNFTRIVVHGETLPFEYLRLTIDPRGDALFSWERAPVAAT